MVWPLSDRARQAVRRSGVRRATAVHRNLVTGATTPLTIKGGSVTDDCTQFARRVLSLTLPGEQATFDTLDTPGGEITVTSQIVYGDKKIETIPLGVFIVDAEQLGYAPGGEISMTCPDRSLKIQRNGFGLERTSIASNPVWREIKRLVEGAWPAGPYPFPGWSQLDQSADMPVGSLLWDDGARDAALTGLCQSASLQTFFDRQGFAVLRPVPYISTNTSRTFLIDSSAAGVMIDANRTRDRANFRNAIMVTTSATDVTFLPVEVKNTTPGDPQNITGPYGYVPENLSLPSIRNSTQARAAGLTELRRRGGYAQTISLTAAPDPSIDSEDNGTVTYPRLYPGPDRPSETHIVDSVTHPLMPTDQQDLQTRSTRPITDGVT